MLTESEIKTVISQTYADVALQCDTDMRLVADVFEAVRGQLYTLEPFDAWDNLLTNNIRTVVMTTALSGANNETNGNTGISNKPMAGIEDIAVPLAMLRENFGTAVLKKQASELDEAIEKGAPDILKIWNRFYADAAVHFREDFICMLCLHRSRWDADSEGLQHDSGLTRFLRENRWVDAFPYYEAIAENADIENQTRMLANVAIAEIIIYYYPDPSLAGQYILKAAGLVTDAPAVKKAQAQLALKNKDYKDAKNILLQVMQSKPSDYLSLIYAGDCFLAEDALKQAESWYLEALQKNALQTDSYKRLIGLYTNPKWFAERQDQVYKLLRRIEERRWFRKGDTLIKEGLATPECFTNSELYHSYRDVAAGYYANENMEKAEDWYQRAISLQPSFAVAMLDQAYLYIKIEKLPDAKTYFDKALGIDNTNFDVYSGLAYYYEKTGQKEEALAAYQQCLQLRPAWNHWIHNLVGNLYFSCKEFETAATYFRMAVNENKNLIVYQQNLADALTNAAAEYAAGSTKADEEKATRYYMEAAALYDNAEAWNTLGNFYFAKQQWTDAVTNFSKASSLNDKEPVYYGNMALAYENLNDNIQAETWYGKAIEADNNSGRYYNRLGILYYNKTEYEKAVEQYKKALEQEPNNAEYLNNISLAYKDMGETGKALESLQARLALDPDNDTLWNNAGVMYFETADYENAIISYQKAISIDNRKTLYYQNLGLAYEQKGEPDKAIMSYEDGVDLHLEDAYFLNAIGLVYYRRDDYEKAISYFQQASKEDENNWLYPTNLGLAFTKNGNTGEAINAYRKALQLNENDYLNWNELGILFRETKEYDKAIDAYAKAIALEPNESNLYINLAAAYLLTERTEEAEQMLQNERIPGEIKTRLQQFFADNQPLANNTLEE